MKLDGLVSNDASFSFDSLNKLCWALGSLSGCMEEEDESKFVVNIIKELLNLCEKKKGKDNKAVVASNIMYVVGQFPRFLENHWPFLKTVIKKLNEFMHETHPGVQDMASETFLKIARLTKHKFVTLQDKEQEPYIYDLIRNLPINIKDLQNNQKLMVYEGIGHIINAEERPQHVEVLVASLLQYCQEDWTRIVGAATSDVDNLKHFDVIQMIGFIVKVNERVADSVGHFYCTYLEKVFVEIVQVYQLYSAYISE